MEKFKYNHHYHQSLVYKIFLAEKQEPKMHITFSQALDIIRTIYAATGGLPQIAYIVGWQFDGHDSKYPAWSEVNPRLKREEDATALDSLLWLMREARRYNAIVSVHINMCDAYENSPLWGEYAERDLLARNADGSFAKGALWGGEQSYIICKKREWDSGLARRRIDAFLEMLPIAEAGTVHIDVFAPRESPFHKVTREDDTAAMVEILHYWKSRGVDVTKEWFHHELAGFVPMVVHHNLDEASRLKYPPDVICGGGPQWNKRHYRFYEAINWGATFGAPEAGCLHEEAWGYSVDRDIFWVPEVGQFLEQVFLHTIPWLFFNLSRAIEHIHTARRYEVIFENGVHSVIADGVHTVTREGQVLKQGDCYCLPAPWLDETFVAYNKAGGPTCLDTLPKDWGNVEISSSSKSGGHIQHTLGGRLEIDLEPGVPAWIRKK